MILATLALEETLSDVRVIVSGCAVLLVILTVLVSFLVGLVWAAGWRRIMGALFVSFALRADAQLSADAQAIIDAIVQQGTYTYNQLNGVKDAIGTLEASEDNNTSSLWWRLYDLQNSQDLPSLGSIESAIVDLGEQIDLEKVTGTEMDGSQEINVEEDTEETLLDQVGYGEREYQSESELEIEYTEREDRQASVNAFLGQEIQWLLPQAISIGQRANVDVSNIGWEWNGQPWYLFRVGCLNNERWSWIRPYMLVALAAWVIYMAIRIAVKQ